MSNLLINTRDRFAQNYPEIHVEVNSRQWGVIRRACDGPQLVFLPGTLGRGDIFWNQIEALNGQADILALTYPDSGGVIDWAQDISHLMDIYEFKRATILGSSLGGFVAQYFASVIPGRVDNLIAANTLSSTEGLDQFSPYSFDLDNTPIETLRAGFKSAMQVAQKSNPGLSDLVELLLLEVGERIDEKEIRARLKALKFAPRLPDIQTDSEKVFTIESADDPLIPAPIRDAVRARLSPMHSFRFTSGGHFPYIVRAKEYTKLVEQCIGLGSKIAMLQPGKIHEL